MNRTIQPAPVRKSLRVNAPQTVAFEVFTSGIGRWWPPTHSTLRSPYKEAVIEPFVGGRWYHLGTDGSQAPIGPVLAWEPPSRVVLGWQLDGNWVFNPDVVTEVEVRFTADGAAATLVELEHRHLERFAETSERLRAGVDAPGGWGGLLDLFRQRAEKELSS